MDNQQNQPIQPQAPYQPNFSPQTPPQTPNYNTPTTVPGKTLAIIGFIMAFTGLWLVGLILSIIGVSKSKKANVKNGIGVAGIILNAAFMVIGTVVAILFAITIVSYNGVSIKANTASAKAKAVSVQGFAEVYYLDNGEYPDEISDFNEPLSNGYDLSQITVTSDIDDLTSPNVVIYQYDGEFGDAIGGRVGYYDSSTGTVSDDVLYTGDSDVYSYFSDLE